MKKHTVIGIIVVTLFALYPIITMAQDTRRPFGGQVLSIKIPPIVCAAQYGPLLIRPVVPAPSMPYFVRKTQRDVRIGGWILGWYDPVPDVGTCKTTTPPPTPVPAFNLYW